MSYWWLWPLWPVTGLLGWAWLNHLLGDDHSTSAEAKAVWWISCIVGVLCGLVSLVTTALLAISYPHEHRWGLRFK